MFWCSNWCGSVLPPGFNLELIVREGLNPISTMGYLLSAEQMERVRLVEIDLNIEDELIFTGSSNGKFSIAKNIEVHRPASPTEVWSNWVWNKYIPHHVNAFMWRVMRSALSVDGNVQRRGITLVSR